MTAYVRCERVSLKVYPAPVGCSTRRRALVGAVHQSHLHDHVASAKPDSEPPQHLIACRSVSSHLTVSQTLRQAWGPLTQQAASADRDFNGKPFAQSEGFRFGKFSFHRVHGLLPCLVSCAHCAHAHTPKGLCAQCAQCAQNAQCAQMCACVRIVRSS